MHNSKSEWWQSAEEKFREYKESRHSREQPSDEEDPFDDEDLYKMREVYRAWRDYCNKMGPIPRNEISIAYLIETKGKKRTFYSTIFVVGNGENLVVHVFTHWEFRNEIKS